MHILSKGAVAMVGAVLLATGGAAPAGAAGSTMQNLQAAFNGEVPTEEKVASLFRAAAKAEEIDAQAHADVIRKLGGEPKADLRKVEPQSTRENVEAALKGETYETETLYPDFMKAAKAEGVKDAVKTFSRALFARIEHAKFYAAALKDLEGWKGQSKDFYVCSVCGFTMDRAPTGKCAICFSSKDKFLKVN